MHVIGIESFFLYTSRAETEVDVIVLSETWFNAENVSDMLGYKSFHSYRPDRRGGGVSIFVKSTLECKLISVKSFTTPFAEFCSVNVNLSEGESGDCRILP